MNATCEIKLNYLSDCNVLEAGTKEMGDWSLLADDNNKEKGRYEDEEIKNFEFCGFANLLSCCEVENTALIVLVANELSNFMSPIHWITALRVLVMRNERTLIELQLAKVSHEMMMEMRTA